MAVSSSYSESNQNTSDIMYAGVGYQGVSQSFTAANSANTVKATFYLRKVGAPPTTVVAKLYAHSGTLGTSSVPTGAALATSNTVTATTLSTSYALVDFTFATPYAMTATTNYVVTVEYNDGDNVNYVEVGVDSTSPTHGGNEARLFSGTWSASSGRDAIFYMYDDAAEADDYTIVTQDIALSLTEDADTITQNHVIASVDIALSLTEDNDTITQNHIIATQDVSLALTEDNATINQNHVLTASDVTLSLSEDATAISQNHIISTADIALALGVDATTLVINYIIATADLSLSLGVDTTSLQIGYSSLRDAQWSDSNLLGNAMWIDDDA